MGHTLERESCCYISAASGKNLTELLHLMEERLVQTVCYQVELPLNLGGLLHQAYASGQVRDLVYTDQAVCFMWEGRQEQLPSGLTQYLI